jgi:signal transduction histidine kinase
LSLLADNTSNDANMVMTVVVNNRDYQFIYAPLRIGGEKVGYYSVALARRYVENPIVVTRWGIMGIALALAIGMVVVGFMISQRITRPLRDLVETAEAVTQGDLEQRSSVTSTANEFGTLALAFNQMTEHLLRLYNTSRDLNHALSIPDVLDVTSRAADTFVPGAQALVLLAEDDGWRYVVGGSASSELRNLDGLLAEASVADLIALTTSDSQRTADAADVSPLAADLLDAGQQRLVLTRLVVQSRVIGMLIFAHTSPDAFDVGDLTSLRAVANMAVTVLHNSALYTRVQRDATERQAILQSIADGVVVCDTRQQIIMANHAAATMLHLTDWDVRPVRFSELPLDATQTNRESFGGQQGAEHVQFEDRTLALSRAPVIANDGRTMGEVIVLHDLSVEVAVSQAKTNFIATISHELRTPLQTIFGYLDLMLRGYMGPLTEEQTDIIKQVRRRASDINDMARNAIMIAHLDSNSITVDLRPQDLHMALDAALNPLMPAFTAKNLTVRKDIPESLPPLLTDRELIKVILTQLLDNARRYTQQGGVIISAQCVDTMVQVDITDTGTGISLDDQDMLFRRFQRIEGNNSPERGGGLGLAITRQVVEQLGGRVWVRSAPGKGSTFSFVLPQADEQAIALAQSEAVATR